MGCLNPKTLVIGAGFPMVYQAQLNPDGASPPVPENPWSPMEGPLFGWNLSFESINSLGFTGSASSLGPAFASLSIPAGSTVTAGILSFDLIDGLDAGFTIYDGSLAPEGAIYSSPAATSFTLDLSSTPLVITTGTIIIGFYFGGPESYTFNASLTGFSVS